LDLLSRESCILSTSLQLCCRKCPQH